MSKILEQAQQMINELPPQSFIEIFNHNSTSRDEAERFVKEIMGEKQQPEHSAGETSAWCSAENGRIRLSAFYPKEEETNEQSI